MTMGADMREVPASEIVAGDRVRIGFATYHVEKTGPAARKLGGVELILRRVQNGIVGRFSVARVFSARWPITRIRIPHPAPIEEATS